MEMTVTFDAIYVLCGFAAWSIIMFILGIFQAETSHRRLEWLLENVVGDTHYNVAGDYIERPFEDVPPTH